MTGTSLKGRKRPPRSKEWCENISKSQQNRSTETRKKMSDAQKGKRLSEEHKQRIRETCIAHGIRPENQKGKQKSEHMRKALSIAKIGVPRPDMVGENNYNRDINNRRFGADNHRYTGTTPLMIGIRNLQQYYDWRLAVFTRDNFTSVISGIKGNGNLNAHHLIELQDLVKQYNIITTIEAASCKELWDVNNGITVLDIEHVALHKKDTIVI
jgi:hypothetical protein